MSCFFLILIKGRDVFFCLAVKIQSADRFTIIVIKKYCKIRQSIAIYYSRNIYLLTHYSFDDVKSIKFFLRSFNTIIFGRYSISLFCIYICSYSFGRFALLFRTECSFQLPIALLTSSENCSCILEVIMPS